MADFSKITITFLRDFTEGSECKIATSFNEVVASETWTFVSSRSSAYEVTTGTPTGNSGEATAINFDSAYLLDNPTNYTTIRTVNSLEITSQTEGLDFIGFKANGYVNGLDFNITFNNYTGVIDYSNIEFILVNSPHYVNIPFNFETTTSVTLDLYVWSGQLNTLPVDASYTLTIPRPSTNFAEFNVDLSNLVQEQLSPRPIIDLSNSTQIVDSSEDSVKWVYYKATYKDDVETIANVEDTLVAVDGYGYYNEGSNPTRPDNNILTLASMRKVSRNGFILFPFINNGDITSISVNSSGSDLNFAEGIISSDDSTKMVQYLEVDVSQIPNDNYVTLTTVPNADAIVYEIVDECRYNPKQVIFKNKFGKYDCLTVFKKSNITTNVESSNFINNYIQGGTYDTTKHQNQKINITATKSIKVNSGYINEVENILYEQMLYSDTIYFYEDNNLVPINLKTSSLEFKTRVNDKLVNYELEFEYAYNIIQNV